MLMRRGEQPQHNSMRTLVPASVRSNDAGDKTDNRVSVMLPHLPVDKADPVAQLRTVHARLTRAKTSGQRQAGNILRGVGQPRRDHLCISEASRQYWPNSGYR